MSFHGNYENFPSELDDKTFSISAKDICSGTWPTTRDTRWLKEMSAEDMAWYFTGWKMRNMSVCLTFTHARNVKRLDSLSSRLRTRSLC